MKQAFARAILALDLLGAAAGIAIHLCSWLREPWSLSASKWAIVAAAFGLMGTVLAIGLLARSASRRYLKEVARRFRKRFRPLIVAGMVYLLVLTLAGWDPPGTVSSGAAAIFFGGAALGVLTAIRVHRRSVAAEMEIDVSSWGDGPDPTAPLILDRSAMSLSGVRCGDPVTALRLLGAPENQWPVADGRFEYRRYGLIAEHEWGKVDYLALVFRDEGEGFSVANAVLAAAGGQGLDLSPATTRSQVHAFLGEAEEREEDLEEIVDAHDLGGHVLELEYEPGGELRRLNLFAAGPAKGDAPPAA